MKRFHCSTSLRHEPHDVRRPHAPGALSFRIAPLSASRHFASRAVWSVRSLHHVRSCPFYGGQPFLNDSSVRSRRAQTIALVSVMCTWQAFYGCRSGTFSYQYSRAENFVDRPSLRSHPFNLNVLQRIYLFVRACEIILLFGQQKGRILSGMQPLFERNA